MTDAFAEIVAEYDDAPPVFHTTVLATLERFAGYEGIGVDAAGIEAWKQLTDTERRDALPHILGVYVQRVIDEQVERNNQDLADRADIETCLLPGDMTLAWDAATEDNPLPPSSGETVIDRQALVNILLELELQRRRAPKEATA